MNTRLLLFGFLAILLTSTQCEGDVVYPPAEEKNVIIDGDAFKNEPEDYHHINDVNIVGDSIFITFGASGCSGDSWITKLIDSGIVAESYPIQRYMRLSLDNKELCEAFFTKTVSFYIKPLKEDYDKVILHLEGWDNSLLYK